MVGEIERGEWQNYLQEFSKRNTGRTARLEVIGEEIGAQPEAEKLPLEGVTFETKGPQASTVEIMLGTPGASEMRHLTHTVSQVERIFPKLGPDGREEALDIESADGTRTLLVFEALVALPANQGS
jgi:hypothetical protein